MKRFHAKARFDEPLAIFYVLLVLFGLVMVYSASSIIADSRHGSQWYFFRQQGIWAIISLIAIAVIMKIDLRRWQATSVPILFGTLILLAVVFAMPARNSAHRWIFLGPLTVQPSELFKFFVIYYLAFSLANPRRDLSQLKQILMPYVPIIGVGLGLILLEPNLGMVILVAMTVLGMFFLSGLNFKHLVAATVPLAGVASFVVLVLGYKKERVMKFLSSLADPANSEIYQVSQAALTVGSGGVTGAGLGDGTQKLFFLPYPHTDFIFAASGEEVGFIGLVVVLLFLFVILWRGFRIASKQPDKFGYLLAAGMTWTLFLNIAVNIGMVLALLPVIGLPLPFVSYGGTSLLVSSAAIGVLLNLSRTARQEEMA